MKFKFFILTALLIYLGIGNAQVDEDFICGTDQQTIESVGELVNTTWTLKVLLVEFSDVKHRNPVNHGLPALPPW